MNIIDDILLLPHRARWHLTRWENLTRRERRRLRRRPTLLFQQRAWVDAFPVRVNRVFIKRVYGGVISDLMFPDHPMLRTLDLQFVFPTSK